MTAMATIREYIASMGAAGAVPEAELDELEKMIQERRKEISKGG